MKTRRALLVVLSMASMAGPSAPVYAQRHGRADAVQTYAHSDPQLEIQWTGRHERDEWRVADLVARDEHSVVVPLSKHSAREVLSGVLLADLLAKRGAVDVHAALLEVHYGLFQKKTLHWQELDPEQTIVVARRNGNRLDALWLIAVDTHGRPIIIKGVNKVVVKSSSR